MTMQTILAKIFFLVVFSSLFLGFTVKF